MPGLQLHHQRHASENEDQCENEWTTAISLRASMRLYELEGVPGEYLVLPPQLTTELTDRSSRTFCESWMMD